MDKEALHKFASRVREETTGFSRKLRARVTGVTFDGRQELISRMSSDTPVKLERNRRNSYDFYAVRVLAKIDESWAHVGFIPRPMNKMVANAIDLGENLKLKVAVIKGGCKRELDGETLNYGLEVDIIPER